MQNRSKSTFDIYQLLSNQTQTCTFSIPKEFIDYISLNVMLLPVAASDGEIYDLATLLAIFEKSSGISPKIHKALDKTCILHFDLYQKIRNFFISLSEKDKQLLINSGQITAQEIELLIKSIYQTDPIFARCETLQVKVRAKKRLLLNNPALMPNHAANLAEMHQPLLPPHQPQPNIMIHAFHENLHRERDAERNSAALCYSVFCGSIAPAIVSPIIQCYLPNARPECEQMCNMMASHIWPWGAIGTGMTAALACALCYTCSSYVFPITCVEDDHCCDANNMENITCSEEMIICTGTFATSMTHSFLESLLPPSVSCCLPLASYVGIRGTVCLADYGIAKLKACLFNNNRPHPQPALIANANEAPVIQNANI